MPGDNEELKELSAAAAAAFRNVGVGGVDDCALSAKCKLQLTHLTTSPFLNSDGKVEVEVSDVMGNEGFDDVDLFALSGSASTRGALHCGQQSDSLLVVAFFLWPSLVGGPVAIPRAALTTYKSSARCWRRWDSSEKAQHDGEDADTRVVCSKCEKLAKDEEVE